MRTLPLLLLLSLTIPSCAKKKDKNEAAAKAAEPAAPAVDKGALPVQNNAKLEALVTKAKALQDRLEALEWKPGPFRKELEEALGPATAAVKEEFTTEYWVTCDAIRCVGAYLLVDGEEVSEYDAIDENKDGYYYGFALLAWSAANTGKVPSSKMKPADLQALATKIEDAESMKWDAALALIAPAGASIKHEDSEDKYWHAVDAKSCIAVSIYKLDDDEVDNPEVLAYDSAPDPFDNDEYARCAMHAMGL